MKRAAIALFALLALAVVAATAIPLVHSDEWWIRAFDFPRVHVGVIAVLTALLGAMVYRRALALPILAVLVCAVYQGSRIFPYTPLAAVDIEMARDVPEDRRITAIAVNVLMGNGEYERVGALIDREDPDILFLMETDAAWAEAMAGRLARYDTVIEEPLDNHYGAIFATKLTARTARFLYLTGQDVPTVVATLEDRAGNPFHVVGLHPRPPVPGEDTGTRDAQLREAARLGDRTTAPVLAMGDFNDVAWSRNSRLFVTAGGYRDPRIGRGILPSFDATSWWMRFPIDQLYVTEGIDLVDFGRMEAIGSDHYPIRGVFAVSP